MVTVPAVDNVDSVVTSPLLETVAMSVFNDAQSATLVTIRIEPSRSVAVAVSCVAAPRVTVVVP